MKEHFALILVICFMVASLGTVALCESDGVTVRVGEITYDVKQVQTVLDKQIALNEAAGIKLTEEEKTEAIENTLENFVNRGLAENRIRELGLDQLSKDADYALREQAQQAYEQVWQQTRGKYADLTDEQITQLLDAAGAGNEAYYWEYVLGYEMELLLEHYGVSVDLTDAELDAFYQENYVAPFEERYANNIPLYESEVLFGDGDSLFVPQGYRRIKLIQLPIPEEIRTELEALQARADALSEAAEAAYNEVAALGVEGKDVEPAREAYAEAKAQLEQIEVEAGRQWAMVLPAVQETVDEIYARLRAGERFEDLSKQYGEPAEDLPYHPDSAMWADEYAQALYTLEKPGDVSQPIVYGNGVLLFYYAEDIPSGAMVLGEEERKMVRIAAQQNLSSRALNELVTQWRNDYEIETDGTQLHD